MCNILGNRREKFLFLPNRQTSQHNKKHSCLLYVLKTSDVKAHVIFKIEVIFYNHYILRGPGSSVGIATGYGLHGPRFEYRWGEIFHTCPDRPWGPPSLLYNGYRVFHGVKSGQGVNLTPHPLLVTWSRKSRAILLLTLWVVRPVQSLIACTVQLYLYSPYGSYGLYRASLPVQ